jgi:CelD/BcsL family acetyltransferase involved in cellulose biosynthesis
MKLHLLTDLNEILEHQAQWNDVANRRPFFQWEWMANWLKHQVDSVTPAVIVAEDDQQRWIGIAPFCVESKPLMRKLRFLGSGPVCSDYLGLITSSDLEQRFAESITDWLLQNLRTNGPLGTIDALELEGVSLRDESSRNFFELLNASGFKSHSVPLEGCWAVDLQDSWEAMNASFSKSLRRKTRKAVQRLTSADTIIQSTDDYELAELWPNFVDLHQKRRQMLGQPGCFVDSNFEMFLRDSVAGLIAAGRAELLTINCADRPLASILLLNDGQTVFMYQSGMDPDNLASEPGYQIAVLAIQNSINKGFRRLDFLRGDEPYKSRWLTKRIPLVKTRFIPRNISSQFKFEIWKTGRSLRQYWKPATPATTPSEG